MRYLFTTLFITVTSFLSASFSKIPPPLEKAVQAVMKFPESRRLLESIEKQGEIKLVWTRFQHNLCYAAWSTDARIIFLNASKTWTEGKKISSIIFEMHNAQANRELCHLDDLAAKGKISMQKYVEAVERMEHQNVLRVSQLIDRGIHQGYFPREAYYPACKDFNEHFKLQIEMGHSDHIAERYKQVALNR